MIIRSQFIVFVMISFAMIAISGRSLGQSSTWHQVNSANHHWETVASSSDGKKLVAAAFGDYIFTSTNSGVIWTQQSGAGIGYWHSVASSADGTKLVAVAGTASTTLPGGIFTSVDSGTTWTQTSAATNNFWIAVASSSDGTKLAAAVFDDCIYTSADSGSTWVRQAGSSAGSLSAHWNSIASSADGTRLIAANTGGAIYASRDSGLTWVQSFFPTNQQCWWVTSSSNAMKLAATGSGYVCTSTNSGTNWTQQAGSTQGAYSGIASSSDGRRILATESYNAIFFSPDSGVTWNQTASTNLTWQACACSSDGTKEVAVSVSSSGIWTNKYSVPLPTLTLARFSSNTPPANFAAPSATNLATGEDYQLQVASDLHSWSNFGAAFSASNATWVSTNIWNIAGTNPIFFRLQMP